MNKNDFPLLFKNKKISYLDNAATTQKPIVVLKAHSKFYETMNANAHRGIYALSRDATLELERAREIFANAIAAETNEIIFTKGTTDSMNMLARGLEGCVKRGKNIVVTEIEHHSNFVPWQQLAKRTGATLRVANGNIDDGKLCNIADYIDENTTIVAFTMMSNVSGLIPDTAAIIRSIRKKNKKTIIILDGAQAIAHIPIHVNDLDCDFLAFSAHKVYGPTGVDILYGKVEKLKTLDPSVFGGHMVHTVSKDKTTFAEVPDRFEAGTMDVAGISAAATAIEYLRDNDFRKLLLYEESLKKYALRELRKISGLAIIGHNGQSYGPVISFVLDDIHPHDLASICDKHGVCIRAGHHCAQPYMQRLKVLATARISLSFYNDKEDINRLIVAIKDARRIIHG